MGRNCPDLKGQTHDDQAHAGSACDRVGRGVSQALANDNIGGITGETIEQSDA